MCVYIYIQCGFSAGRFPSHFFGKSFHVQPQISIWSCSVCLRSFVDLFS